MAKETMEKFPQYFLIKHTYFSFLFKYYNKKEKNL